MPASKRSGDVLVDILKVLERIEENLARQNGKFQNSEHTVVSEASSRTRNISAHKFQDHPESQDDIWGADEGLGYSPNSPKFNAKIANETLFPETAAYHVDKSEDPKTPYSFWSFNERAQEFEESFTEVLDKILGDYWRLPCDNRLSLLFFHSSIMNTREFWDAQVATYNQRNTSIGLRLDTLRHFDSNLRKHQGNDFLVLDLDAGNTRLYRPGQKAIGKELFVDYRANVAPWSRLILYQGMTTGGSLDPQERGSTQTNISGSVPYFGIGEGSIGLWSHLYSHLQLKQRKGMTNPYLDEKTGFHTTFFEICSRNEHSQIKEVWKNGPLYEHPLGYFFRKCAYTLYTPVNSGIDKFRDDDGAGLIKPHWTILLLAPDNFFDENNSSFPMKYLDPGRAQALGHCLGKLTRLGAEMNLIGQGLQRISERWSDFQSFFEFILDKGDSLMNPQEHDRLLFDDGSFSRSRLYFWAIDCLSEFELSITDTIKQWELYKDARVLPLFQAKALPELDFLQFKNAERQHNFLLHQREYFKQKLASTKTLRDALFSASSVIESRGSTRTGENVKLLTYVSIFFLPLAFCTSLWSINDKFSSSALIAAIIIVALATYIIMFNLNSLVYNLGLVYEKKKKTVVKAMRTDTKEIWKQRGTKFETFYPKHENPVPSEWYISLYALLNPLLVLGIRRNQGGETSWSFGIPNWFRKRPKQRQDETRHEVWEL